MEIRGCVALVTGSKSRAWQGARFSVARSRASKIYAAARDVTRVASADPHVVALALDTTNPAQVAATAKTASDVTLLITTPGSFKSANVLTMSQSAVEADFRTNVYGTLEVIKAFVPVLERPQGGATISNVLSLSSLGSALRSAGTRRRRRRAYSTRRRSAGAQAEGRGSPSGARAHRYGHGSRPTAPQSEPGRRRKGACSPGVDAHRGDFPTRWRGKWAPSGVRARKPFEARFREY